MTPVCSVNQRRKEESVRLEVTLKLILAHYNCTLAYQGDVKLKEGTYLSMMLKGGSNWRNYLECLVSKSRLGGAKTMMQSMPRRKWRIFKQQRRFQECKCNKNLRIQEKATRKVGENKGSYL
ncbi:hypothetical protein RJ641_012239 [Dillenia turbinata]|uniref:Uncharacterized protein n=1 Tax=Dillenia turbinata TaxID=194707 RepID=A0AAN8V6H4_9MAGN